MLIRTLIAALSALLFTVSAALLVGSPGVAAAPSWTWPVQGEVLTGYRNGDDPYAGGQHRGVDIAAEQGTPVAAAAGGRVRFAGVAGSSGLTVSVRTADGRYDTSYLHLSSVSVREGEEVSAGDALGAVGVTGRRSVEAPHLHFGVRDAGSRHAYHDPLTFLHPPAARPAPQPPPEPVPVAAPVPVAPAPAPAPAPVRVPAGRRVGAPDRRPVRVPAAPRVRVPAGRRVRVPAGGRAPSSAPVAVGQGAPARVPNLGPAPAGLAHGAGAREGARPGAGASGSAVPSSRGEAAAGPAPGLVASGPGGSPAPARTPAAAGGDGGGSGPDLGWAAACLGLLLAAALLGRPGERQGGGEGAAVRLRALVKPLMGGR